MLTQELARILKGTLFVKNDPQIITITSSSSKERHLSSLVKSLRQNIRVKDKGIDFSLKDDQNFSIKFENDLKGADAQSILFNDLSFELEFGYFSHGKNRLNQFKDFARENQKLSK